MEEDFYLGLSEEGFHHIYFTEWGKPDKNDKNDCPVICVHGFTRNSRDFDTLANYLAKKNKHVFCPDMIGRGQSQWLKDATHYTYEQYIADIVALISKTQAKEINFIGTSMGGLIGIVMASLSGTPIKRLILNDVGPQIPLQGIMRIWNNIEQYEFNSFDEAVRYFKKIYAEFGELTELQWQKLASDNLWERVDRKFILKLDPGINTFSIRSKLAWEAWLHPKGAFENALFDINLWDKWRKIKCPVAILRGQHSEILTPAILQKMLAIHPQTKTFEVPNTGHAPLLLNDAEHHFIAQALA